MSTRKSKKDTKSIARSKLWMDSFLRKHKFASESDFDLAVNNFTIDVEGGSMKITKVEQGTRVAAAILFDILYEADAIGSIKPMRFDERMAGRFVSIFGKGRCDLAKKNRTIRDMNLHLLLSDTPVHFLITCSHRYRKETLKLS